jgi:hypothetical protein
MISDPLYETCIYTTQGDKYYCKQILDTLMKLSRERVVMYRGKRGVRHIVILPDEDEPVVDIVAGKDKSLIVRIKSRRYVVLIRYVYDSQFKPTHAVISNIEYVKMLNMYMSVTDILNEIFMRGGDYE